MNRRFLRPLFSFWDPFFSEPIYIRRVLPTEPQAYTAGQNEQKKQSFDPNQTFDNFFKDYYQNADSLKPQEKEFFQKHFPQKIAKKFNPYEVLGIDPNSDIDKVNEAYRTNAIKYHPKNNITPQEKQKFEDVSRAYNQIVNQKQTNDYGEDVSTKSLFEDFNKQMEKLGKIEKSQKGNEQISGTKPETKQKEQTQSKVKSEEKKVQNKTQDKSKDNILNDAQLYSQTSFFQYVNGKKKFHITKMYEKNGKTIKVDRMQQNRKDGSIEVTQTFDDGKQVKNKKYIQGANRKDAYLN